MALKFLKSWSLKFCTLLSYYQPRCCSAWLVGHKPLSFCSLTMQGWRWNVRTNIHGKQVTATRDDYSVLAQIPLIQSWVKTCWPAFLCVDICLQAKIRSPCNMRQGREISAFAKGAAFSVATNLPSHDLVAKCRLDVRALLTQFAHPCTHHKSQSRALLWAIPQ